MQQLPITLVMIKRQDNIVFFFKYRNQKVYYDISLVIVDFLDCKQVCLLNEVNTNNKHYSENPFSTLMELHNSGYKGFDSSDLLKGLRIATQLKELLGQPMDRAEKKFSMVRHYFHLKFSYEIKRDFFAVDFSNDTDTSEPYLYNWKDYKDHNFKAKYICYSISDMIAAIFHYYLIIGFKITSCAHCEKGFAADTRKMRYCNRKSPYRNTYSQKAEATKEKSCYYKVDEVIKYAKQKKKRLKNNFKKSPRHTGDRSRYSKVEQDIDLFYNFSNKCAVFEEEIKKAPTKNNLDAYLDFLDETEKEKAWCVK